MNATESRSLHFKETDHRKRSLEIERIKMHKKALKKLRKNTHFKV